MGTSAKPLAVQRMMIKRCSFTAFRSLAYSLPTQLCHWIRWGRPLWNFKLKLSKHANLVTIEKADMGPNSQQLETQLNQCRKALDFAKSESPANVSQPEAWQFWQRLYYLTISIPHSAYGLPFTASITSITWLLLAKGRKVMRKK